MNRRNLWEALGAGAMAFLVGIAVYGSFKALNADTLYEPTISALLQIGTALGLRSIPSRSKNDDEK